jgi:dihydrolipoamide dehydrogenase
VDASQAGRSRAREDEEIAEHERIHLVRGWASLTDATDPHVVRVDDGDSHPPRPGRARGDRRWLATRSRSTSTASTADRIVTNENLFELEGTAVGLLIVGGGAIAIEMATAFAAIGTRVDIVELQDRLLASEDELITEVVERSLRSQGVSSIWATTVERFDGTTAHLVERRRRRGRRIAC